MGNQTVVRTYPQGWNVTNERLKKLLNDGYRARRRLYEKCRNNRRLGKWGLQWKTKMIL